MSNNGEEVIVDSNAEDSGEEVSSPDASPGKLKGIDPSALEELDEQLNGLAIDPEAFVRSLPAPVRRRVKALKKLQFERVTLESKFYEELHQLEAKYAPKFAPLDERRANIASGEVEPTDSECEWKSDTEEGAEDQAADCCAENQKCGAEAGGDTKSPNAINTPDIKGVPDFWLTVLKHAGDVAELIHDDDEPILSHLTDIKLKLSGPSEPISYTLEFHFSPNDYFTNKVLTKKYMMKMDPDEGDVLFDGPEISKSEGCEIDWKQNKNVTVKTIKKKQTHKKSGVKRTVTKQVTKDSFFNFFSPPSQEEQDEPSSDEVEAQMQSDYEIGHFFREQLVPRAVLYFTGEALDDSDDEDFDDEDDEDDDDEDYPMKLPGGIRGQQAAAAAAAANGKNPDCKQQ